MVLLLGRATLLSMLLSLTCAGCGAAAPVTGLRNATAYARVPQGVRVTLEVRYKPVWASSRCSDDVYVQAPDGSTLLHRRLLPGDDDGAFTCPLDRGAGDYRISFQAQTYRVFGLSSSPDVPMAIQCPPVHMALSTFVPEKLYFSVPEGTDAFDLCIKHHGPKPIEVVVTPPDGRRPLTIPLREQYAGLKSRATMRQEKGYFHNWEYEQESFEGPAAGTWTVEIPPEGRVSVWLQGIPNVLATTAADLFVPQLIEGHARVTVDATDTAGPMGMLGASFPPPAAMRPAEAVIPFIGLQSLCKYQGHKLREPANDDDDPEHINWAGLNWGAEDPRYDAAARWGADTLVIIHPADWLGGRNVPTRPDRDLAEYAEFVEAFLIHYNVVRGTPIRFLSLLDEPNSSHDVAAVERLLRAVGERIARHPDERVRATRIMVPQSSMYLAYPNTADREGVRMAERLYSTCDEFAGGIAWDQWTHRNLFDTSRYREAVERSAQIIRERDSDGQTDEPICIYQTNFFGGGSISFQDTRTFYASLWWASVVANAMKPGKLTSLNWYMTFDDEHHMKGLCYGPDGDFAIKPVGYAMKMLIETMLDDVVVSSSSHPEVDELATISADGAGLCLMLVNKLPRENTASVDITPPEGLRGRECAVRVSVMESGDEELRLLHERQVTLGERLQLEQKLRGEAIYVVTAAIRG